jgi:DNA-binding FrmR family transcriptional regulator
MKNLGETMLGNKGKLLQQIRCIGGQFDSIERAIRQQRNGTHLLRGIVTARDFLDSLLLDVVAAYIRFDAGVDFDDPEALNRADAIFDLVKISVK